MRWAGLLLVCAFAGETRPVAPAPPDLPVEIAGCDRVVERDVCELPPDRTLRVFVPSAFGEPRFSAPVSATHGTTHSVIVPEAAGFLTIRAGHALRLVRLRTVPPRAWYVEARALRKKGDVAAAHDRLLPFLSASDPLDRALAIGLDARIALASGRVQDAVAGLRQSLALHRSLGRTSDVAEDSFALAFALNQRSRRYEEARAVLDELEPELGAYGEGRVSLPFYRAELALETGDLRAVIRGLRASLEGAERLSLTRLARNARSLLAIVLHMQGRFAEGMRELRTLDAEVEKAGDATPCERSEILLNIALSIDDARTSGLPIDDGETPPALAPSLAGCPDPHLRGLGEYVFAADALEKGRPAEASTHLAKARAAMTEPRTNDVLLFGDLEARIALAEGDADRAIELHARQVEIALASDNLRRLWLAHVGAGEALEKKGDDSGAIAAYLRAESVLDQGVSALPLHEGRGALLQRSERSARAAVTLLLSRGRVDEAFSVARRARARLLRVTARAHGLEGLDASTRARFERTLADLRKARGELDELARNDWQLSTTALAKAREDRAQRLAALRTGFDDALSLLPRALAKEPPTRSPSKDEAWILAYPTRGGFVGFVATSERVRSFELATLLAQLSPEIDAGRRIVVLPYGPLRSIDVHALPHRGGAVIDATSVAWSLDLGTSFDSAPVGPPLIVGDPTNDLPAARAEAQSVARALGGTLLLGGDASTERVLAAMSDASRLHWAGHGIFGGLDGLESRLPLAMGQQIGPVEILALSRVPSHVVLSACESARNDEAGDALGLAQSFVVAGARDVIAPTRRVDDALAAQLSALLYVNLGEGHPPVEALRRAQHALRTAEPNADWAAFRVFLP